MFSKEILVSGNQENAGTGPFLGDKWCRKAMELVVD